MPIPFLYSSILIGIFCTSLTFQDRTPSPLPSPACFSCRLEASARGRWHRAGLLRRRGDYYLGCGRRRYCGRVCCLSRRRVLALPQCFLAVSRSPSSIPPTESLPGAMPPSSGVPQPHPPLKTSKTSPTASTPGAMPPSSGVPQPHPPTKPQKHPRLHPLPGQCHLPLASLNHIHLTKPQTYPRLPPTLRADVKKNLSHRHETPTFSFPCLPKKNKMYYTY